MREEFIFVRKNAPEDQQENIGFHVKILYDEAPANKISIRFEIKFKCRIITTQEEFNRFLKKIVINPEINITRTENHDLHLSRFLVNDIDNNIDYSYDSIERKLFVFTKEKIEFTLPKSSCSKEQFEIIKKVFITNKKDAYLLRTAIKFVSDIIGESVQNIIIKWGELSEDGESLRLGLDKKNILFRGECLKGDLQELENLKKSISKEILDYNKLIARYKFLAKLRCFLGQIKHPEFFRKTQDVVKVNELVYEKNAFPKEVILYKSTFYNFKSIGLAVNRYDLFETHNGDKKNGNIEFWFSDENFGNCFFVSHDKFEEKKDNLLWNSVVCNVQVSFVDVDPSMGLKEDPIEEQIISQFGNVTITNDDGVSALSKIIDELQLINICHSDFDASPEPISVSCLKFKNFYENLCRQLSDIGDYELIKREQKDDCGSFKKFQILTNRLNEQKFQQQEQLFTGFRKLTTEAKSSLSSSIKEVTIDILPRQRQLCYYYNGKLGSCRYGDDCKFFHDTHMKPLSQKASLKRTTT